MLSFVFVLISFNILRVDKTIAKLFCSLKCVLLMVLHVQPLRSSHGNESGVCWTVSSLVSYIRIAFIIVVALIIKTFFINCYTSIIYLLLS